MDSCPAAARMFDPNYPEVLGGATEPEMVHFTITKGAKEPRNPQNHRSATPPEAA